MNQNLKTISGQLVRIEGPVKNEKEPIKSKDKTPLFIPPQIPNKPISQISKPNLLEEINKRLVKIDVLTTILDTPKRSTPSAPLANRGRSISILFQKIENSSDYESSSNETKTNNSKKSNNLKINKFQFWNQPTKLYYRLIFPDIVIEERPTLK